MCVILNSVFDVTSFKRYNHTNCFCHWHDPFPLKYTKCRLFEIVASWIIDLEFASDQWFLLSDVWNMQINMQWNLIVNLLYCCVCVCVCVCVRARARARACVCVCVLSFFDRIYCTALVVRKTILNNRPALPLYQKLSVVVTHRDIKVEDIVILKDIISVCVERNWWFVLISY